MKTFWLVFLFLSLFVGLSFKIQAQDRQVYIREEMKLLKSYLSGIQSELKNPEPQAKSLALYATLLVDTVNHIRSSKTEKLHHEKITELLGDAEVLQKSAKANHLEAALTAARSISNNCTKCHKAR